MTFGGNEAPGYMTGENAFTDWLVGVRHSHLDGAGYALDQKLLEKESSLAEQARALAAEARFRMTLNSLMICLFARGIYTRDVILEGLDLLWRPCTGADLEAFDRETLKRKYELKRSWGWRPEEVELPGKLDRMVAATGPVDPGRIRERAALYWAEVGL
jgi:aldehyde:ferredoxin oxidoreductase